MARQKTVQENKPTQKIFCCGICASYSFEKSRVMPSSLDDFTLVPKHQYRRFPQVVWKHEQSCAVSSKKGVCDVWIKK